MWWVKEEEEKEEFATFSCDSANQKITDTVDIE